MAQGDNKIGQKGTNSIFVMTHKEIATAKNEGITDPKKKIQTAFESQLGAT
jgi:hypothetical protein